MYNNKMANFSVKERLLSATFCLSALAAPTSCSCRAKRSSCHWSRHSPAVEWWPSFCTLLTWRLNRAWWPRAISAAAFSPVCRARPQAASFSSGSCCDRCFGACRWWHTGWSQPSPKCHIVLVKTNGKEVH